MTTAWSWLEYSRREADRVQIQIPQWPHWKSEKTSILMGDFKIRPGSGRTFRPLAGLGYESETCDRKLISFSIRTIFFLKRQNSSFPQQSDRITILAYGKPFPGAARRRCYNRIDAENAEGAEIHIAAGDRL